MAGLCGEMDEPCAAESPRHYREHQVARWAHYRGPLDRIPEDEVRALFAEILTYFDLVKPMGVPLPPSGLPGVSAGKEYDDRTREMLTLGFRYFLAAVRNEGRAMHNLWERADTFARDEMIAERRRYEARLEQAEAELITERGLGWRRREEKPQLVYFIGAESGPIKIGIAVQPGERLKTLQTSHHERLNLLAVCEGGQTLEREYHKRFAAHRLHGEWFERHPDILAEIERLSR